MVLHLHLECQRTHLLAEVVLTALPPAAMAHREVHALLISWRNDDESVTVVQYPEGLRRIEPDPGHVPETGLVDVSLVIRPAGTWGAQVARRSDPPGTVRTAWAWFKPPDDLLASDCPPPDIVPPTLPDLVTAEHLEREEVTTLRVGIVVDAAASQGWMEARQVAEAIVSTTPGVTVHLLGPELVFGAGDTPPNPLIQLRTNPGGEPGRAYTLLLILGREPYYWQLAYQAAKAGSLLIVHQDTCFRGLLPPALVYLVSGAPAAPGAVQQLLQLKEQDSQEFDSRCRRIRAWGRRFSAVRTGDRLLDLLLPIAQDRHEDPRLSPSRRRWVVRREIGIGDILFSLTVAHALRERDPEAELFFHTAPEHATWVRWFDIPDQVTSGEFQETAGSRIVDLEREFPSTSNLDRTLALGRVAGVLPECWGPPPALPEAQLHVARRWLGETEGLRIALITTSKGQAPTRSLPDAEAAEVAAGLRALGQVVWLDEVPRAEPPPEGVLDLCGRLSLTEAFAVLAATDLCVSVDSGLLYFAAALRKPVVGLFTHIAATQRLWLAQHFLALQPALPCVPCGEGPDAFHCVGGPLGAAARPPCTRRFTAELVTEACQAVLSRPQRTVWSIGREGSRLEIDLNTEPAPWPPVLSPHMRRSNGSPHATSSGLPTLPTLTHPNGTHGTG